MPEFLSFGLLTFTTFLPMVDPVGNMSIFAGLTEGMPQAAVKRVAVRACTFALGILLMFGFFGEDLFELFGITLNGLKVVGGVIFMIMGYDMLQARVTRTKVSDPPNNKDRRHLDDIALTPLGIPLLAGPGGMTAAIIQMGKASTFSAKLGFVLGVTAMVAFALGCLIGSARIARILGPSGTKVIVRLMGLMLMVIAVESFFSGLTPIVRDMLLLDAG
jgi:multiple antibiotic resistance protein